MKKIVLTGATRGLGLALVESFTAAGHTVYGCGRSMPDVATLAGRFPSPHRFDAVDVADDAAVAAWAKSVLAESGSPDMLINNAALMNRPAKLWDLTREEFDPVIDVNIKGVVNVLRHFLPAMVARRQGVIVNLSSGWGRSTSPEVAPYCATKYAVEGLTLALAEELPDGMAAIPLSPGVVNTDMLKECYGAAASRYPSPTQWSKSAAPYLLGLTARHNGKSLTVPAVPTE